MIAGLSGLIAGDPAMARAAEPTAIAASAAAVSEQAIAAQAARRLAAVPVFVAPAARHFSPKPSFVPQTHKVDERRNE